MSYQCTKKTCSCPSSAKGWKDRAANIHCKQQHHNYTCMLTDNNDLVEACMAQNNIPPGVGGCPYIAFCDDNRGPILIRKGKYSECPESIKGCPPKDHSGYSIFEMYKYPACFLAKRTSKDDEKINEKTSAANKKLPLILVSLVIVLILAVAALVITVYIIRRKRCARSEEFEIMINEERTRRISSRSEEFEIMINEERTRRISSNTDYTTLLMEGKSLEDIKFCRPRLRKIEFQEEKTDMSAMINAQENDGIFVKIEETDEGARRLFRSGSVAFVGVPGSGKTMNAVELARMASEEGYRVIKLTSLKERSDFKNVSIIFFEEIFQVQNGRVPILDEKRGDFETISARLRALSEPIGVIFTIQSETFKHCESELIRLGLLTKDRVIDLNNICEDSKGKILEKHFSKYNMGLNYDTEKLERSIISCNTKNLWCGFPLMVHMLCTNEDARSKGMDYFYTKNSQEGVTEANVEGKSVTKQKINLFVDTSVKECNCIHAHSPTNYHLW